MNSSYIKTIVQLALAEDLGRGDITSNYFVSEKTHALAYLMMHEDGVIGGLDVAREVFKSLNSKIQFKALVKDGQSVSKNTVIAKISGPAQALLSVERVALNFLSLLSAIATQTRAYVDAVKPYKVDITDTRKTTPLLRQMERYAVLCGGGVNHRFNLNDMVMIKDNHLTAMSCPNRPPKMSSPNVSVGDPDAADSLIQKIANFKKTFKIKLVVEVNTLKQFKTMLDSEADIILLDNMGPELIKKAVHWRGQCKKPVLLEASGGITLKNIKQYAATGVERISVGALTHTRRSLNISLEFISVK